MKHKFIKDIGFSGLTNLITSFRGIIILPIITKILGASNYGVWTQISVTVSLIAPIIVLGLPNAIVRFLIANKDKEEIKEGIWSVFLVIVLISLAVALIFISFANFISSFLQVPIVFIFAIAIIIVLESLNSFFINLFRAFNEITKYSIFNVFNVFGEIVLVAFAVLFNYGLQGAILALIIIRVLAFLILFIRTIKKIGIKIPQFIYIREYLHFSLPIVTSNISYWGVQLSDRYIIGFFMGILFVGYYSPAYSIGNLIYLFIVPFIIVLPVTLSQLFDNNKIEDVKIYLEHSLKYLLMIGIPAVFGISILSHQILRIFSTMEIADNSYFIVPFIAISILFYGIYTIFTQILFLFKKTKIPAVIWVFAMILNIGLNIALIPKIGLIGTALSTLLSYVLATILVWYYSFRYLQFKIDYLFIIKSIIASIVMSRAIIYFNPRTLAEVISYIIMGVIIYALVIFVFKGIGKKEFNIIFSFLKRA